MRRGDGSIAFDGGTGAHGRDALLYVASATVHVRGVAPSLDAFRAEHVHYRVQYTISTPIVWTLSVLYASLFAGTFHLMAGSWRGTLVVWLTAGTLVGGIWRLAERLRFRRFLADVLGEATADPAASSDAARR